MLKRVNIGIKVFLSLTLLIAISVPSISIIRKSDSLSYVKFKKMSIECNELINVSNDRYVDCLKEPIKMVSVENYSSYISKLDDDGVFNNKCHAISHLLGRDFFLRGYSLDYLDKNICSQGLLHGYLEGVGSTGNIEMLVKLGVDLCNEHVGGCAHGFGHSLSMSKLSYSKISEVCRKYGNKLSIKGRDEGGEEIPLDLDLFSNCVAGYVMQENIDLKLEGLSSPFNSYCGESSVTNNLPCHIAVYRINSNKPGVVVNGKFNFFTEIEGDIFRERNILDFYKFCRGLNEGSYKIICFKTYGNSLADVFGPERSSKFLSLKINNFCNDNKYCFEGYFSIIYSLLNKNNINFIDAICLKEVCEVERVRAVKNKIV